MRLDDDGRCHAHPLPGIAAAALVHLAPRLADGFELVEGAFAEKYVLLPLQFFFAMDLFRLFSFVIDQNTARMSHSRLPGQLSASSRFLRRLLFFANFAEFLSQILRTTLIIRTFADRLYPTPIKGSRNQCVFGRTLVCRLQLTNN